MELPQGIAVTISAIASILCGIVVVVAGIGLAFVPASIPILSPATQISSIIYVVVGVGLLAIGCGVLYSSFQNTVGDSRRGRGFNR